MRDSRFARWAAAVRGRGRDGYRRRGLLRLGTAPADSGNTLTINGNVPIAYAKRSTSLNVNPTNGAPFAAGWRPDDPRAVLAERARVQRHRGDHPGQRRRVRPRGVVRRQEDRVRDALPDQQHVERRRRGGLHRSLEHLGIRHERRGCRAAASAASPARRPTTTSIRRTCRPTAASCSRRTARRRPSRRRSASPTTRSTNTSASACSTCTRSTATAAPSRRSRSTRATTATRWCGPTATSCSRAGSTSARATASPSSASSPTAPTCSCSTARTAAATASCIRATWTREARTRARWCPR